MFDWKTEMLFVALSFWSILLVAKKLFARNKSRECKRIESSVIDWRLKFHHYRKVATLTKSSSKATPVLGV